MTSTILLPSATRLKVGLTSSSVRAEKANFFIGWQKLNAQQKRKLQSTILLPVQMAALADVLKKKKSKSSGDPPRLVFRRSLESGLRSFPGSAGRVSGKVCLWRKFII